MMTASYLSFDSKIFGTYKIVYNGDTALVQLILDEIYGNKIYKSIIKFLKGKRKPVILDIGAHIGLASLYFSQIKDAVIHAIEPNPYNFDMLRENTKNIKNITCHNVAIGGIDSKRTLVGGQGMAESFYESGDQQIKVTAVTLKTFLDKIGISHVDAIKIDCEGEEYAIFLLPGFRDVASQVDFIMGESHLKPGLPQMIAPLLEPLGFKVRFLPIKNLKETYSLTLEDGTHYEAEALLNTMFAATK